jgi:hypothetical protein
MKKLLIMLIAITMAVGAYAQHSHRVVVVGAGFGPYYNPYYPYYGYAYPYPRYALGHRPTKLDLKIEDIQNDYKQRIWAAKHDTTLPHKERRREVRQLKHDRDQAISDAKHNYYRR